MGTWGQVTIGLLFWFLLTCICVSYTAGGAEQLQLIAATLGMPDAPFLPCSVVYLVVFAALGVAGTKAVDFVNRLLVYGVMIALCGLLVVGMPKIDTGLLVRSDWGAVYPAALSICILAFGAMNTVPTILLYLGGDAKRTHM